MERRPPWRPRLETSALALTALSLLYLDSLQFASAQNRFDIEYEKRERQQKQNVLQRHPDLIHKYNPSYTEDMPSKLPAYTWQDRKDATYWQTHENRAEYEGYDSAGDHNLHIEIDKDVYRYRPAAEVSTSGTDADYRMNLIVDPCRGHPADCCYDISGTPEYIKNLNDPNNQHVVDEANVRIPKEASRLQDQELFLDETCMNATDPKGVVFPRKDCKADRIAVKQPDLRPVCWDHNTTVDGTASCTSRDGATSEKCVQLGYTQNAYVVQCGGAFKHDPHCGTYIEIHKPGDETIINEVQLPGGFPSGYRTVILPLSFKGRPNRVICFQDLRKASADDDKINHYELWWVTRTPSEFIIERKKGFSVISPQCHLDPISDSYLPYAIVGEDKTQAELDYVAPTVLPYEIGSGVGIQQYR